MKSTLLGTLNSGHSVWEDNGRSPGKDSDHRSSGCRATESIHLRVPRQYSCIAIDSLQLPVDRQVEHTDAHTHTVHYYRHQHTHTHSHRWTRPGEQVEMYRSQVDVHTEEKTCGATVFQVSGLSHLPPRFRQDRCDRDVRLCVRGERVRFLQGCLWAWKQPRTIDPGRANVLAVPSAFVQYERMVWYGRSLALPGAGWMLRALAITQFYRCMRVFLCLTALEGHG